MKGIPWLWAAVALACGAVVASACGGATSKLVAGDDGGATEAATGSECPPCKSDGDCGGAVCAQLGGDSYCAPACPGGNECSSDRQCTAVTSTAGAQVSVCVPRGGSACSAPTGPVDAGGPSETCGTFVGPDVPASCNCSSGQTCTANGCYGGWWCDTSTNRCHATPPAGCGSSGGDGGTYGGDPPVTGSVGPGGGSVSRLYFAVVGDTRPPSEDDTANYPTAIITQIYTHMQALSPSPTFAVSTGDYQYAAPSGSEGATQLDLYAGARAKYSGTLFPTMGNHECTGYTNSNCGTGNPDGLTNNYNAYLTKMLGPINQTSPSYEIDVNAADGSWTAKFLFVAANAWTQDQANWLDQAMAKTTTYTFLVRHESASANTAPGVAAAENIMLKHPYTLSLVGHTHTYEHSGAREVIIGNGGAPVSGGKNYGFGMLSQQTDGSIAVDMVDYASGQADASFHFAVKPDGSPAP